MNYEPLSLNPHPRRDDQALRLLQNILSPLVGADYYFGTGEIYPNLAQSWDVSPDARVYTFHLFQNVSWHDGVKFTSADVAWTINEIIDKAGVLVRYFTDVEKIETPDEYTVRITLKTPNSGFLYQVGGYSAPLILPKHLYEGTDWNTNPYNQEPVGTGPFKFVEWIRGDHITMEAYDGYHLGRPYLDRVIVRAPVIETLGMTMLRAGEIHYYGTSIYAADALALQDDPRFDFHVLNTRTMIKIMFNMRREPLGDLRVRNAICHAINISDLNYRLGLGITNAAAGQWFEDDWAFNPDAKQPEYDPEKAEELLDEAGYPRDPVTGVRFETSVGTFISTVQSPIKIIVKEYLKEVGIECSIWEMSYPEYWERTSPPNLDFDICSQGGNTPDPVEWGKHVSSPPVGLLNYGGFPEFYPEEQARIDELMLLGQSVMDTEERAVHYREVQQILADTMPRINLWEEASAQLTSSEFGNTPESIDALGPGYLPWSYVHTFWKLGSEVSPATVMDTIETVEDELADLEAQGYNVTAAMKKLSDARDAYDEEDYVAAHTLANAAVDLAIPPARTPYELYALVVVVVIIVVGVAAYFYKKRKR